MQRATEIPSEKVNASRRTFVKMAVVTGGSIAVTGVSAADPPLGRSYWPALKNRPIEAIASRPTSGPITTKHVFDS